MEAALQLTDAEVAVYHNPARNVCAIHACTVSNDDDNSGTSAVMEIIYTIFQCLQGCCQCCLVAVLRLFIIMCMLLWYSIATAGLTLLKHFTPVNETTAKGYEGIPAFEAASAAAALDTTAGDQVTVSAEDVLVVPSVDQQISLVVNLNSHARSKHHWEAVGPSNGREHTLMANIGNPSAVSGVNSREVPVCQSTATSSTESTPAIKTAHVTVDKLVTELDCRKPCRADGTNNTSVLIELANSNSAGDDNEKAEAAHEPTPAVPEVETPAVKESDAMVPAISDASHPATPKDLPAGIPTPSMSTSPSATVASGEAPSPALVTGASPTAVTPDAPVPAVVIDTAVSSVMAGSTASSPAESPAVKDLVTEVDASKLAASGDARPGNPQVLPAGSPSSTLAISAPSPAAVTIGSAPPAVAVGTAPSAVTTDVTASSVVTGAALPSESIDTTSSSPVIEQVKSKTAAKNKKRRDNQKAKKAASTAQAALPAAMHAVEGIVDDRHDDDVSGIAEHRSLPSLPTGAVAASVTAASVDNEQGSKPAGSKLAVLPDEQQASTDVAMKDNKKSALQGTVVAGSDAMATVEGPNTGASLPPAQAALGNLTDMKSSKARAMENVSAVPRKGAAGGRVVRDKLEQPAAWLAGKAPEAKATKAQKVVQPATAHTLRKSVSDVQHTSNQLPSPISAMEGMTQPIVKSISAVEHTGDGLPPDIPAKRKSAQAHTVTNRTLDIHMDTRPAVTHENTSSTTAVCSQDGSDKASAKKANKKKKKKAVMQAVTATSVPATTMSDIQSAAKAAAAPSKSAANVSDIPSAAKAAAVPGKPPSNVSDIKSAAKPAAVSGKSAAIMPNTISTKASVKSEANVLTSTATSTSPRSSPSAMSDTSTGSELSSIDSSCSNQWPEGAHNGVQNMSKVMKHENVCYITSLFQAFNAIRSLINKLKELCPQACPQITTAMIEVFMQLRQTGAEVSLTKFKTAMGTVNKEWQGDGQQCAMELYRVVTDNMNRELNRVIVKPKWVELSGRGTEREQAAETKANARAFSDSPVDDVFGALQQTIKKCQVCQNSRCDFANSWYPELKIPQPSQPAKKGQRPTVSIDDCLKAFIKPVVPGNDFRCKTCQGFTKLELQQLFWEPPQVMLLHPERLSIFGKDRTILTFDETLDLTPYCNPAGLIQQEDGEITRPVYKLVSVIYHGGESGLGHYTADCRSMVDGRWRRFNDSHVSELQCAPHTSDTAYMLFYELQHQAEPLSPEEVQKIRCQNKM